MLGIAVHNEKRMVFMDIIVHELAEILKSETDIIHAICLTYRKRMIYKLKQI